MDLDAFVGARQGRWSRLDQLTRRASRPRRLSGAEVDELVDLYQRTATDLSRVRSAGPDPALVARLSGTLSRARAAVAGAHAPAWRDVAGFLTVTFPAVLWRTVRWWAAVAAVSVAAAVATGVWVATHPAVQAGLVAPEAVRELVQRDFADYYSSHPAGSFAAQVWTNNAWVAAGCLALGVLLLPPLWILWQNVLNVGVVGGLMAANGRTGLFLGLILPHGMLELTAVFVAAGAGLRLGWTVVDPGPRTRLEALGAEGRATLSLALGLVLVLLVSGLIEAFVTPSPLPTWARIGVGALAEGAFLSYVVVLGRRAAAAGVTGDLGVGDRPDVAPTAG